MLTILLERLKMFLLHFVKYCKLGRAYHIIVTACCALTFFQQIPIAHIYSMVSTVLGMPSSARQMPFPQGICLYSPLDFMLHKEY